MKKDEMISNLRKENFAVKFMIDKIELTKQFGIKKPRVIKLLLEMKSSNLFLHHPRYLFVSTISHFASTQEEVRFSLNKTILSSVIKSLKRAKVWQEIDNQKFLAVNSNNNKSDKQKVKKELESLLK